MSTEETKELLFMLKEETEMRNEECTLLELIRIILEYGKE